MNRGEALSDEASERLFYLGAGPLAAILLGMLLASVRETTVASNFTFLFLALTIAVAEFGGRWPAVGTALASALSLDFFLTQPYGRLSIESKNDFIAFVGLGVCGLLAAALASDRGRRGEALQNTSKRLSILEQVIDSASQEMALEQALRVILRARADYLPIEAAVVRDGNDVALAATSGSDALRPLPSVVLLLPSLLPEGDAGPDLSRRSVALPPEGARIALSLGSRRLGWLDVWGSGSPASAEARSTLSDVARLLALQIAATAPRP
jgi:hypothetical protein